MGVVWAATLALAVALVLPLPGVTANQGDQGARVTVQDAAGDPSLEVADSSFPAGPDGERVDILEAWFEEDEASLGTGFRVATWNNTGGPAVIPGRQLVIGFAYGEKTYRVVAMDKYPCISNDRAFLQTGGDWGSRVLSDWQTLECIPSQIDYERGEWQVRIPKANLTDMEGTPLRFGRNLSMFHALARQPGPEYVYGSSPKNVTYWIEDRAPDAGYGRDLEMTKGRTGAGPVAVFSPAPVRFSNGESTVMVFPLVVDNLDPNERTFLITATHDEQDWKTYLPARVVIPGSSSHELPLVLTIGFGHRHGETAYVHVRVEDSMHPQDAWASTSIGVHWPRIGQLSGHHPMLHVHGPEIPQDAELILAEFRLGWLNAEAVDPDPLAKDQPLPAVGRAQRQLTWSLPYRPQLQIGLDFEPERSGRISGTLVSTSRTVVEGAQLQFDLLHAPDRASPSRTLVSGTSEPMSLSAQATNTFEFPLNVAADVDVVPYTTGGSLVARLQLLLETPIFDNWNIRLDPASTTLVFPLQDYHDPVDESFRDIQSLALRPTGATSQAVNPGETRQFEFELSNALAVPQDVRLSVEGHNSEWGQWVSAERVSVAGASSQIVRLAVVAPADAAGGERAELFAVAESVDAPERVALSRLRITVDELADLEDEPVDTASAVDTPFLGPVALLFGIGAAWRVRARRH